MKTFMILAGIVCVFYGGCTAQRDLRLMVFGETTKATVTLVQRERYEGKRHSHSAVEFEFKDQKGKQNRGRDRVDLEWERPADRQIDITYLPASPSISELKGNWQLYHWTILIIGIGLLGGTYASGRYTYRAD